MPPMDRKPPLAVSPRRLRPRRNLHTVPTDLTPPATAKTRTPIRSSMPCGRFLHPEHPPVPPGTIKKDATEWLEEIGDADGGGFENPSPSPTVTCTGLMTFERGRFYELYSARRNERLKRRQVEFATDAAAVADDPGVAVELAKRRHAKKAAESVRKSVPASFFSVSRTSGLRSSTTAAIRSSKEMKKGSLAAAGGCQKAAAADAGKRIGTRSVRRI